MRMPGPLYRILDRLRLEALKFLDHRGGNSYMVTEKYLAQLVDELAETAARAWNGSLDHRRPLDLETIRGTVEEFFELYKSRPIVDNRGGSGFHNCFWLFFIARSLRPSLIVESGVWRGQTSWLLSAASPEGKVHGFDLDLRKAVEVPERVHFHEMDWTDFEFGSVDPSDSLCFFDCHVNQARRVREAYERGFRLLLFDDNPPTHKLAAYGVPGVPTIDMIMRSRPEPGEVIEWVWRGQPKRYVYDPEEEHGARDLVSKYRVLPDVGSVTGFGGFSFLSLVELAD